MAARSPTRSRLSHPALLALLLSAAALSAACSDDLPVSPGSPAPRGPLRTTFYQPANWRAHWQSGAELWVYDKAPELALNSHLATYGILGQQLAAAPDMGMRLVRTPLYWRYADPEGDGVYDTSHGSYLWTIGEKVRIAGEQNVQLLFVLDGLWPTGPEPGVLLPWYGSGSLEVFNQKYRNFAQAMVNQFPQVKFWQVWNEQDAGYWAEPWTAYYGSSWYQVGEGYAKTLRAVYPVFRDAVPRRWMLTGGLTLSDTSFLRGMYNEFAQTGKPYPLDILAVHGYGFTPTADDGAFNKVPRLTQIASAYGDGNRPIWATEVGTGGEIHYQYTQASASGATYDSHQRDYYQTLASHLYASPISKAFAYSLWDEGGFPPEGTAQGANVRDYGLALVRENLTDPRPSYVWLRDQYKGTNLSHWNQPASSGDIAISTYAEVPGNHSFEYASNDETMHIKGLSVGTLEPTRVPMIIPVVFHTSQPGGWSGPGWTGHVRGTPGSGALNGFQMVNGQLPLDVSVCYTLGFRAAASWEPEACNGTPVGGPADSRVLQAITMRIVDPQQRGWTVCYQAYVQDAGWTYPESCNGGLAGWGGATIQAIRVHIHRN